jgi:hypothetical protein
MPTRRADEFRRRHLGDPLHHLPVGPGRGHVRRDRLARAVNRQRIGTELQQKRHHLLPVHHHGKVKGRSVILVPALSPVEG